MLCEKKITQINENQVELEVLVCAQNPSLNPQLLVTALEVYAPELTPDAAAVQRLEVFDAEGKVFR